MTQQRVSTIELLTDSEREELLVKWNNTSSDYAQDRRLHQLFEAQVERTPQAVALVFEDEHLSFDEVNRQANQLARHLRDLGVGPEVRVGLLLERSTEMVVCLLAVLKAGGAYVPLDPAYPRERLSSMLADSSVFVLLTQQSLLEKLSPDNARLISVDTDCHRWQHESHSNLDVTVEADNLAYVIFTSGSTGRPKGAMNSHRAIVNRLLWMQQTFALTSADTVMRRPLSASMSRSGSSSGL